MDRKRRELLLREAVLRAVREFDARPDGGEEETAGAPVGLVDLPRPSYVPDTLRELVEG